MRLWRIGLVMHVVWQTPKTRWFQPSNFGSMSRGKSFTLANFGFFSALVAGLIPQVWAWAETWGASPLAQWWWLDRVCLHDKGHWSYHALAIASVSWSLGFDRGCCCHLKKKRCSRSTWLAMMLCWPNWRRLQLWFDTSARRQSIGSRCSGQTSKGVKMQNGVEMNITTA